jgi:hypothetical protein
MYTLTTDRCVGETSNMSIYLVRTCSTTRAESVHEYARGSKYCCTGKIRPLWSPCQVKRYGAWQDNIYLSINEFRVGPWFQQRY